jgi:hypothetical protein
MLCFRAGVDERPQVAADVVDMPIADRTRQPLAVAVRVEADLLAVDTEADVVPLIRMGAAPSSAVNSAFAFARSLTG